MVRQVSERNAGIGRVLDADQKIITLSLKYQIRENDPGPEAEHILSGVSAGIHLFGKGLAILLSRGIALPVGNRISDPTPLGDRLGDPEIIRNGVSAVAAIEDIGIVARAALKAVTSATAGQYIVFDAAKQRIVTAAGVKPLRSPIR